MYVRGVQGISKDFEKIIKNELDGIETKFVLQAALKSVKVFVLDYVLLMFFLPRVRTKKRFACFDIHFEPYLKVNFDFLMMLEALARPD